MSRAAWAAPAAAALGLLFLVLAGRCSTTVVRARRRSPNAAATRRTATRSRAGTFRTATSGSNTRRARLPLFVPSLVARHGAGRYGRWFDDLMALCGAASRSSARHSLRAVGAGRARTPGGAAPHRDLAVAARLGVLPRFDLWPAPLAVLALAALSAERLVLGGSLLGLGDRGEALARRARSARRRARLADARPARRRRGWTAPRARRGCRLRSRSQSSLRRPASSFHAQIARPLQLESLGGAVLIALHHPARPCMSRRPHGSQNLDGHGRARGRGLANACRSAPSLGVWMLYARAARDGERLITYTAAAVAAIVAFGKVFSPQFVIWLVPFVPLVRGRARDRGGALLLARARAHPDVVPIALLGARDGFAPRVVVLLARDLALVALAGCCWASAADRGSARGRARSRDARRASA